MHVRLQSKIVLSKQLHWLLQPVYMCFTNVIASYRQLCDFSFCILAGRCRHMNNISTMAIQLEETSIFCISRQEQLHTCMATIHKQVHLQRSYMAIATYSYYLCLHTQLQIRIATVLIQLLSSYSVCIIINIIHYYVILCNFYKKIKGIARGYIDK